MSRRRVAIIGAGFSGSALAAQLLLIRGRGAVDVVLIERGPRFGPGLAYGAKDRNFLLNVRAANMSALVSESEDFVRWLSRHRRGNHDDVFARRERYGVYIEDVLDRARRGLGGARLKRVRGDAVACSPEADAWRISLSGGQAINADAVVLALGNPGSAPPPILSGLPIIDAWDARARARIPRKADVLLVGTGLTMVDVALALAAGRHSGVIYALSRRGLVPRAQVDASRTQPFSANEFPQNLSDALHAFRREVRAMAARGEPWQWAFERIRPATPELWLRLTLEQKQRFLRHLRPWWDVHRHRAAPEIAARINDMIKDGRLRVLAGEIAGAQRVGRRLEISHRQRGSFVRHRLEVGAIVNCTGTALDVARSAEPLIAQLRTAGLVRPNPTGLGFDVDKKGRLVGMDGSVAPSLFSLGPPTQGMWWETTAVPEIRVQAEALAKILTAQH
jgi:uncharacterized NAD(P)/FAD-binding protein YdhS